MCKLRLLVIAVILVSVALRAPGQEGKLFDVVKIEFPKDGYSFTLAEAAKGIKIEYKIVIAKDVDGVIAIGQPPSYHEPAGPSGLYPREQISGNNQMYCLRDFGLAPPPKEVVKTLKKGTYTHAFEWDGRNWNGPSDTGQPRGKAFPAGTYDLIVTIRGKLVSDKGKTPYEITGKTSLVVK
jgi:hypothetical protein